jgi:hypothetical protein
VSTCKKSIEEPLEDHHLPARVDQLLVHDWLGRPLVKRPIEQEWVRANFAQLHYNVLKMHVVHFSHCFSTVQHPQCEEKVKERTLGLESIFFSNFGSRLGHRRDAGPALACTRAYPTHLLILLDLACDLLLLAFSGVTIGSRASQQPPEATFNNSVVHFVLTLAQRRVEYILLLGRKRTLDVYFKSSQEKWTENLVQLVDEH